MQFVINSSNLDAFLGNPEFLTGAINHIVSMLSSAPNHKRSTAGTEIVLDIGLLDLQSKGPAIVQQLAKFIRELLSQKSLVVQITIEDEWLTNPLILKANAFLTKTFPNAEIKITGKSGQVLSTKSSNDLPSYVQVLPGENPYPTMNISAYQDHIQSRIKQPFTLNQGPTTTCGVAAYLIQILVTQPRLYTALAHDLVTTGRSDRVVPLIGPHPDKISGIEGIRPSSSGMLISAFNQAETFLAQQGIPVEMLGWLKGIINAIPPKAFGEKFDLFKKHVFDDIAGKVANMPRQIVNYLIKSGYKVKKESAKMLPMEFLSSVLGSSQNPELVGAVADIQRLTYSDIHSQTPQTDEKLFEEFREIEARLKKGYQALLLLETQWNWKITHLGDEDFPSGLNHYNYCNDFHLYQHHGQNKVKFTIYTWGERFEVKADLTEFAAHYCGVILSKPKALLFSKELTTPAEARKIYKERKGLSQEPNEIDEVEDQHLRKRGRRPQRECNKTVKPYLSVHGRDKSPKKQRTRLSHQ